MKLKELVISKDTQPRVDLDQDVISEYAELLREGVKFPPVTVFFDSTKYYLVDGHHRYHAHKLAGFADIESTIINGTYRDAVLYAVGANDDHGIRRTNADKRKAVNTLLEDLEWMEWTDSEIARKCKVSRTFVTKVKESLTATPALERKYIKDGVEKTMDVSNIVKLKPAPKPEYEFENEDELSQLKNAHKELAEENAVLSDKLAVVTMTEDQANWESILKEYRETLRVQELEITALTNARNHLQSENAELIKQVKYWRKRAEKAVA